MGAFLCKREELEVSKTLFGTPQTTAVGLQAAAETKGSGGDKRQQRTVWAIESASHLAEQRPRRHRILKLELGLDLEQPDQWVGGQLKLRRCQELDRLDVHGLG